MKLFLKVIAFIVIGFFALLFYFGGFDAVKVIEKETPSFNFAYQKHVGDYRNVANVMVPLYNKLVNEETIMPTRGFGIYYDNPEKVAAEKLRSVVGSILDGVDDIKVIRLQSNFNIDTFPTAKSIVVEFPYKNAFSIFVGLSKVYPVLKDYMKEHNYPPTPVLEIYDPENSKISYIVGLNIDKKFFAALIDKQK